MRPRSQHRRFYVETAEGGLVVALAKPGQTWQAALAHQIENYRARCAAMGEEPMAITPIDRVKL